MLFQLRDLPRFHQHSSYLFKHMETLHTITGKLKQDMLAGSWATILLSSCQSAGTVRQIIRLEKQCKTLNIY